MYCAKCFKSGKKLFSQTTMSFTTSLKVFNVNDSTGPTTEKKQELPEEPTSCCMSGCANCVWVEYAEKMTKLCKDGDEIARQKIISNVSDPNIREFILMELRMMAK